MKIEMGEIVVKDVTSNVSKLHSVFGITIHYTLITTDDFQKKQTISAYKEHSVFEPITREDYIEALEICVEQLKGLKV